MNERAAWIAVDWGTTNLRAWAMSDDDRPIATATSPDGMGGLAQDEFEPALIALIGDWLAPRATTDIVVCGMAGARAGWLEAPYREAPFDLARPPTPVRAPTRDPRLSVRILPGARQAEPADVMRGEETQLAGLLRRRPDFDGAACLPGTHSKWVALRSGRLERFTTVMTGELFALLAHSSILRDAVAVEADGAPTDWEAFEDAVDAARDAPERTPRAFFGIRAAALAHGLRPASARARLSGLLIGSELAATRDFWEIGDRVALIGAPSLTERYARALARFGHRAEPIDGDVAALAGLSAARAAAQETETETGTP